MSHESPLGKLADASARRDASHIAIMPAVATHNLIPGEAVNIHGQKVMPFAGIVDPFLREPVRIGDRFWIILFPNTVTNLRHEWDHPDLRTVEEEWNDGDDFGGSDAYCSDC